MRYTQKHPQHTYIKRDVYYFSRVIPSDLKHHYSKPRIIQSLKTKSAHRATVASKMLSAKLDDYWLGLRHLVSLISDTGMGLSEATGLMNSLRY